jgi:hypothetical protein
MRSPNTGVEWFPGSGSGLDRARIQQWNVAFERKLPGDIAAEIAYVGTATDGGYADLNVNYGVPGGGNASHQFYASAGSTDITDWGSRTKARYKALQVSVNRPFRQGVMLKGAYTWSHAQDMADEDGWTGLTWNSPLMYAQNFATSGFDRTHIFQMGFSWELPFLKQETTTTAKILGGWQVSGIFAAFSGTPFSIGGTNNALNCAGCGAININVQGDPSPTGSAGNLTTPWYDPSLFSQPTGVGVAGFGNSLRNQFRRPADWNFDFSLFKAFGVGRVRPEFKLEIANLFNHVNWGAPVTDITQNNFMQFTPSSSDGGGGSTNTPGPRRVQIGFRVPF